MTTSSESLADGGDRAVTTIQTDLGESTGSPGLNLEAFIPGLNSDPGGPDVYRILAEHQTGQQGWTFRTHAAVLQKLAAFLVARFKLGLSELAFCVENQRFRGAVRFRKGVNGLGLRGEIQANAKHLTSTPAWQLMAALLVALLHAWQQEHGNPGGKDYCNDEFRRKARECGLDVGEDGSVRVDLTGAFAELMRACGVPLPEADEMADPIGKPPGDSKQKKWSCGGCDPRVNARVAIPDFEALCLKCRTRFVRQDRASADSATNDVQPSEAASVNDPLRETWLGWVGTVYRMLETRGRSDLGATILAVKLFREITGLGLKEAKELVEEGFAREAAKDARRQDDPAQIPSFLV